MVVIKWIRGLRETEKVQVDVRFLSVASAVIVVLILLIQERVDHQLVEFKHEHLVRHQKVLVDAAKDEDLVLLTGTGTAELGPIESQLQVRTFLRL